MRAGRWIAIASLVAATGLLAACGGGGSKTSTAGGGSTTGGGSTQAASGAPIVIGAAIDFTDLMKFTDDPAYYGAQLEVKKINAEGGVDGRPLKLIAQDTKLKPDLTKKAAIDLVAKGADIGWVTCDVDWATPAVQEFVSKGMLTIAPCLGTDQMGPKRFGDQGKLAFSFGNVAQDEGAALAAMAKKNGYKTAVVVTDKVIVYTRNVCEAFKLRFEKLGGKIVDEESFTQGDKTINSVISHVNNVKADAIAICTIAAPDTSTFLSGIRTLGNNTPIISPWSIDGTFWMPKDPKIATNFWNVTLGLDLRGRSEPRGRGDDRATEEGRPRADAGWLRRRALPRSTASSPRSRRTAARPTGRRSRRRWRSSTGSRRSLGKSSFSPQYHSRLRPRLPGGRA